MKKLVIAGILATMAIGGVAIAAATQVHQDAYRVLTRSAFSGRSDGLAQEKNSKALVLIENGQSIGFPGAGQRDTFAYGDGLGIAQLDSGGGGTCAGNTTTVPCIAAMGKGLKLAWFPVVTATLPLDMDATSLDIAGDQVENDGTEIVSGVLGASGRPFIVGDDPAFYFCATLAIEDVSGTDDLHMGFREAEPFNAVFDDYTDLASIGSISGNIYIETILGNAATTSTDTTDNWADTESHKLCTFVSNAGVVTYTIDGSAPTTTAAYTLADGLPVIPFIHFIHAADLAGEIDLTLWEVGFQD